MVVVAQLEQALRQHLQSTKINLAAIGNTVPHVHVHVHWHVIARFGWDSHFPAAVWVVAQREHALGHEAAVRERLPAMEAQLGGYLGLAWLTF